MPIPLNEHLRLSPYFVDTDKSPGFNWERYQSRIDDTPENLFNVLVDENTSEFIKSLTQKYIQLSVQGADIARLIRDTVLADIFIGDMPQEITRRLGVDPATAREIANLIVSQLFAPVLEDIKKVHNEKYPGRLPEKFTPLEKGRPEVAEATPSAGRSLTGQAPSSTAKHYQGQDLPESGGNIIDLRNK
ncbi:MAG: hypothetical protein A2831_02445 [Candidatus Yanofskybacteria bacterium RIFCSPHIGHO2_01_FULL_44_17]|uniref:Uncharacterized protein n=1 Tax=Candidatus Yanofskybacteria bacterium RIFCSPHIGHO2_01_FULL_44_17 TaxID=1802668 RepID=A0A1F8ESV5_9BACT|nr:MAG: hypothetical protein A2831_02445 [Candidatus Yanofskybacteria bacterium RIFCSPHIGHO2_01_FULL_44_17]